MTQTLELESVADPQENHGVEKNLIAALLDDPRLIDTIEFDPQDFHQPLHEAIWVAVKSLYDAHKPVDPETISDAVTTANPGRPLSSSRVWEFSNPAIVGTSGHYYAALVSKAAQRRRIIEAAQGMLAQAHHTDPEVVLEQASSTLDGLAKIAHSQRITWIGDDLDEVIASLEHKPRFTPTPWKGLNELIGGFVPGAMYVIGARPAAGKSVFALQAALGLAQHGSVAFISLEMSRYDLLKRAISNKSGVFSDKMMTHDLTDMDWDRIAEARPKLAKLPVSILDDSSTTITQMRRFVRTIHKKKPLAGIVLDYLQILDPPPGDRRSKVEYVGAMSRELKKLAMQLDVPVIAVAQLNRKAEEREGKEPRVSDLREAGNIEQDADAVILLQRDPVDEGTKHEVKVIVGKNRRGSTGSKVLDFKGYKYQITEPGEP